MRSDIDNIEAESKASTEGACANYGPEPSERRGRRRLRLARTILLIGVLLGVAVFSVWRVMLSLAVRGEIQSIQAQNEPVTLADLSEWYSNAAADKSGHSRYAQAFEKLVDWERAHADRFNLLPVVGHTILPETGPLSAQTRDAMLGYLTDNAEAIRLFHEAATGKTCRFDIDLGKGLNTPLPHLSHLRSGARLLTLEAVLKADTGDVFEALESVDACMKLAASLGTEPTLLSCLVKMACENYALGAIEYIVNRAALNGDQLERLRTSLAAAEDASPMVAAVLGERCITLDAIQNPSHRLQNGIAHATLSLAGPADLELVTVLAFFRAQAANAANPVPQPLAFRSTKPEWLPYFYAPNFHKLPGVFNSAIWKRKQFLAQLRAARLALAIEHYRQNTGTPPLSQGLLDPCLLVPVYIDKVPRDPLGGQKLRSKLIDSGFVVYSVGVDSVDDGGEGTMMDWCCSLSGSGRQRPRDIAFRVMR